MVRGHYTSQPGMCSLLRRENELPACAYFRIVRRSIVLPERLEW
jgi:hypothetical protein